MQLPVLSGTRQLAPFVLMMFFFFLKFNVSKQCLFFVSTRFSHPQYALTRGTDVEAVQIFFLYVRSEILEHLRGQIVRGGVAMQWRPLYHAGSDPAT